MNTFLKILKFVFYTLLMIFAILLQIIGFMVGLFVSNSNKSSKGYYKEVEEKGRYTGKYD